MPSHDFKSPRLHVDADLVEAEAVGASPVQANYLLNVLRLGEGDAVLAFNGRDGEWRCELRKPAKKKLDLVPLVRIRDQTPLPDLLYLFAPLKHARLDYMVQKAVEMGAGTLQPVMTQHVQASRINIDRMRANAIEAAEQCGILSVPDCRDPIGFAALLAAWDPARHLIFCDEREEAESPIDTLRAMPPGPLALLVGPEGGFSEDERAKLRALPFVTVMSLGPRILRADTAAVAALAVLQAAVGDWREG
ncbi:16S rRNA (uracil(1498)-N(3))-methyltransferase [Aurantimonas aggregata]|uniref:Ribosomal RNA small subunit methyltransferase E n=1 Tax=Aurantimonas aggregata TaxID=2047720 RepID=A0A6L9ME23_9HYPH|nr:16S rRNA (uracil(1498)-N(3))-methyltransferase [Aurantimonas aggregata]NDV86113.1 16S rRNA (uracil(1498)-N(3))-methyltransferase [Aurantimonas aggregata]